MTAAHPSQRKNKQQIKISDEQRSILDRRQSDLHELQQTFQNLRAEQELVSAIFADPFTYLAIQDKIQPDELYHSGPRCILSAMFVIAAQRDITKSPITKSQVEDVLAARGWLGSEVKQADLDYIHDLWVPSIVAAAQINAETIRRHAIKRDALKLNEQFVLGMFEEPEADPVMLVDQIVEKFVGLSNNTAHERDSSIDAIMDEDDGEIIPGLQTGLKWFDKLTGGLHRGMLYSIGGRYKGRKTSFLRNVLLRLIVNNTPISIVTLDGTRRDLKNAFIAMLAAYYLLQKGYKLNQIRLSSRLIAKALRTPHEQKAIEWAESKLRGRPLYIYDGLDKVQSIEVASRKLKRDILLRGVQVVALDYAQKAYSQSLFGKAKGFEHFEAVVDMLQRLGVEQQVSVLVLSQKNEASNKEDDDDSVSGDKYGGSLAANADFVFRSKYDQQEKPDEQEVRMTHGRYAGYSVVRYEIEKRTGLIVDTDEIGDLANDPAYMLEELYAQQGAVAHVEEADCE